MNRRSFFGLIAAIAAVPSAFIAQVRRTWLCRDSTAFQHALDNCGESDVIVLEAGKTYQGRTPFIIPSGAKNLRIISEGSPDAFIKGSR